MNKQSLRYKTLYHLTCRRCGKEFDTHKPDQIYCGRECANLRRKKRTRKTIPDPLKTFDEILAEIEQYNQEHGTRLTYGQWVAKGGKLTR